jgi:hypothetical protein
MSMLSWCLIFGNGVAVGFHADDLIQSGFFSWLAADSTSVSTQRAAQYADALALVVLGYGALLIVKRAYLVGAPIMCYMHFTTTGSSSKLASRGISS